MKYILKIVVVVFLISCSPKNEFEAFEFLEGTWKVEGQEMYEYWKITNTNLMEGKSYKIKNKKESNIEFLMIKKHEGKIVFEALAIDQKVGKQVLFTLNTEVKDKLSFENSTHNFPTKIQYTKISDTEIYFEVSNQTKTGFTAKMFKQ